jgi:saccharopine dehydrogenase (NAD+, L-lysine-forming)
MSKTVLHLRSEQKPLEHRSCLTPSTAKALIDAGYEVHIEKSPQDPSRKRIYDDSEFEKIGATLVEDQSWTEAPTDHIILGLKELDVAEFPLKHTHVQFAHCYKEQAGWQDVLSRFPRGGGTLLDLEFLEDDKGRRVAAFGFHAGFAGSALAIKQWIHQQEHGDSQLPGVENFTEGRGYYENENQMLNQIKTELQEAIKKANRTPRVLVMGALGRCGRGAVEMFQKAGIPEENIIKWDLAETAAKPGPYPEIVESDIFVNCVSQPSLLKYDCPQKLMSLCRSIYRSQFLLS